MLGLTPLIRKLSRKPQNQRLVVELLEPVVKKRESLPFEMWKIKQLHGYLDESIYGQKTPNLEQIDTKGFLMDFGSFDHA